MAELTNPLPSEAPLGYAKIGGRDVPIYLDTEAWEPFFRSLKTRIEGSPERLTIVDTGELEASVGTTPLELPALPTGLYRISVYARITRAATTSSSLTVSIHHTDGGANPTKATAAMTGNTTATTNDPFVHLIHIDEDTALSYSTTYVSVGATPMKYRVFIVVEAVPESVS
ncbi:MAG TPA: hypothetical protein VEA38_15255 [Terriglobales bacterium]|nr:hypothetical protein [Terriglobales bacterium]